MEVLVNNFAHKIALELSYTEEQEKVIAYGLIATLQTLVMTFIVVIFGAALNILYESLILCFAVSILRKYSGGAHSSSITTCTTIGVSFCTVFGFIIKTISIYMNSTLILIIIGLITFIWAFIISAIKAPVDSIKKPIKTTKKKNRMKIMTIIILVIYLLISTVFIFLSKTSVIYVSLYLSIIVSIIWQISSLTYIGGLYLVKLDRLIYGIITLKGGHTDEKI